MENIAYIANSIPPIEDIIAVYVSSGIKRPTNNAQSIQKIYEHSNLVISAWSGELLVGIARSLTDFCYCCYLSDLAVRSDYQRKGIGRTLISITKEHVGTRSTILLLAEKDAVEYYQKVGFKPVECGFIIEREMNE